MKLMFTDTSLLSGVIFSSILLSITAVFIKRKKGIFTNTEVKLLLLCFFLLAVRLFFPLELSIGHSFYFSSFYMAIWDFLRIKLWGNFTIVDILYFISAIGSIVLLFRKLKKYQEFLSLLKTAEKVKEIQILKPYGKLITIPVLKSEYAKEPFLIGVRRPQIIFPQYMTGEESHALNHELTHYKNHDLYYKWIFEILSIIYWWNPIVYFLKKYLGNMLELHNDFTTTSQFSKEETFAYTDTLLKVAKSRANTSFGLGMSSNQSFLKTRIYSLLNEKKKGFGSVFLLLLITLTVSSFFCIVEPMQIPTELIEEENLFIPKLSYALKTDDGYEIYMNERFIGFIYEIPDSLKKDLKIQEKEN